METTPEKEVDLLESEIRECIGIATFNDPRKANCLSTRLLEGLLRALDYFQEQKVRVVILRAYPGVKIWSAGFDLREIHPNGSDPLPYDEPFEQVLHRVIHFPVPVIGMIEGSVWGGACDLAMTCDLLIGTPTASFAITPAKIGIAYNTAGLNHFMGMLPIHMIKQMLFTGEPLSSQEAYRLGMLNKLVEAEELEETTLAMARTIASRAPLVVQLLKREIQSLTGGRGLSPDEFEEIHSLRRRTYRSKDFKEGVTAFFEKRAPNFVGE